MGLHWELGLSLLEVACCCHTSPHEAKWKIEKLLFYWSWNNFMMFTLTHRKAYNLLSDETKGMCINTASKTCISCNTSASNTGKYPGHLQRGRKGRNVLWATLTAHSTLHKPRLWCRDYFYSLTTCVCPPQIHITQHHIGSRSIFFTAL